MDNAIDVVRAWKDEEYRNSLTPDQLAHLPPNPAGNVELSEEDLDRVSGGTYYYNGGYYYFYAPQTIGPRPIGPGPIGNGG